MTAEIAYPVGTPMEEVDRTGPRIGGSEAPVIALGKVFDMTPAKLYLQKLGEGEPFSGNVFTRVGTLLEPYVREWAKEFLSYDFKEVAPWVAARPDRPWMRSSLDGRAQLAGGTSVQLEIKTTQNTGDWGESWAVAHDAVPRRVQIQAQHNLETYDDSLCYVVVVDVAGFHDKVMKFDQDPSFLRKLVGMLEKRVYEVWRDGPFVKDLVTLEMAFVRCVEERQAPEVVDFDDVKALYPEGVKGTRKETESLELAGGLLATRAELALLKVKEKSLMAELGEEMQGISALTFEGEDILRWQNNKGFNEKDFAADHPALHSEYCRKFDGVAFGMDYGELRGRYMQEGLGPRKMTTTKYLKEATARLASTEES